MSKQFTAVSAQQFAAAFITANHDARSEYDDETWQHVWSTKLRWSHHMLWDANSVLRRTAQTLGLGWARGEYLRLDAVLTRAEKPDCDDRFPIQVALEHENTPRTMVNEVRLLLSARAPLKVGITAVTLDMGDARNRTFPWLATLIGNEFLKARATIGEDPKTEYLFLFGEETSLRSLEWRVLTFRAGDEPPFRFADHPL